MKPLLFLIVLSLSASCVENAPMDTTKKIHDVHQQIEEVKRSGKENKNILNRPKLKKNQNYKWSDSIR